MTTTVHGLPCEVPLTPADGVPRDCAVNCDVLMTVSKARFVNRVTRLSAAKMNQVITALKFAMDMH